VASTLSCSAVSSYSSPLPMLQPGVSNSCPSRFQASAHQPSTVLTLSTPLAAAFMPLVPLASYGRRGVFSQTSQPCTRYLATAVS